MAKYGFQCGIKNLFLSPKKWTDILPLCQSFTPYKCINVSRKYVTETRIPGFKNCCFHPGYSVFVLNRCGVHQLCDTCKNYLRHFIIRRLTIEKDSDSNKLNFSAEEELHSDDDECRSSYSNYLQNSEWERVPIVNVYISSAGKDADNSGLSKTEITWVNDDSLNCNKIWNDTKQNVAFEAVFIALRQAIYVKQLSQIIIKTNSAYICNFILPRMPKWKKDDFLTANSKRMKNSDYLEELNRLLELIEAKFVFTSLCSESTFAEMVATTQDEESSSTDRNIAHDESLQVKNIAYVSGVLMPSSNLERWRQAKGACGVFWSFNNPKNIACRVSLFPATRNRCHLQAIILALKKAYSAGYKEVTVRTCFKNFLGSYRFFKKQAQLQIPQITNAFIYKDIFKLENKFKVVRFEYINSNDPNMKQAVEMARNALLAPKIFLVQNHAVNETKSKPSNFETKLLSDGFIRVRICCRKIDGKLWYGDIWERNKMLVPHIMKLQTTDPHTKNLCYTLIHVLKKAKDDGHIKLVLRISSRRFIEMMTYWLPKWRSTGWKTSTKKPLKYTKIWKELDRLLNSVEIRWEYNDEKESDEDVAALDEKANDSIDKLISFCRK